MVRDVEYINHLTIKDFKKTLRGQKCAKIAPTGFTIQTKNAIPPSNDPASTPSAGAVRVQHFDEKDGHRKAHKNMEKNLHQGIWRPQNSDWNTNGLGNKSEDEFEQSAMAGGNTLPVSEAEKSQIRNEGDQSCVAGQKQPPSVAAPKRSIRGRCLCPRHYVRRPLYS
jgi:hypothetical protein